MSKKNKIKDNNNLIKHIESEKLKIESRKSNTNDFHQAQIYDRDILIKNRLISDLKKENEELSL